MQCKGQDPESALSAVSVARLFAAPARARPALALLPVCAVRILPVAPIVVLVALSEEEIVPVVILARGRWRAQS